MEQPGQARPRLQGGQKFAAMEQRRNQSPRGETSNQLPQPPQPQSLNKNHKWTHPELEKKFRLYPYTSQAEAAEMAQITGMTPAQVWQWFSNRRRRERELKAARGETSNQPPQPPQPQSRNHNRKPWTHPELEERFRLQQQPSRAEAAEIAQITGMTPNDVWIWFKNRRKRDRNDASKLKGEKTMKRRRFTKHQELVLNKRWSLQNNPSSADKHQIAQEVGLDDIQVYIWFKNKNYNEKRKLKNEVKPTRKISKCRKNHRNRNKAVYTTASVAYGWAGALMQFR